MFHYIVHLFSVSAFPIDVELFIYNETALVNQSKMSKPIFYAMWPSIEIANPEEKY